MDNRQSTVLPEPSRQEAVGESNINNSRITDRDADLLASLINNMTFCQADSFELPLSSCDCEWRNSFLDYEIFSHWQREDGDMRGLKRIGEGLPMVGYWSIRPLPIGNR
jgi:hypothetical protein